MIFEFFWLYFVCAAPMNFITNFSNGTNLGGKIFGYHRRCQRQQQKKQHVRMRLPFQSFLEKKFCQKLEIFGMLWAWSYYCHSRMPYKICIDFLHPIATHCCDGTCSGRFFCFLLPNPIGPTLTTRPYDDIALAISCSPWGLTWRMAQKSMQKRAEKISS